MRLFQPFKSFFLSNLFGLYLSGAVVWIMATWFQDDRGFGPEPRALQVTVLQIHSIVGLLFLILFGYLWATHIVPAFRRRRRLKTGIALTIVCVLLIATVPFLFYAAHEDIKSAAGLFHTYLGLASLLPFALHFFLGRSS